MLFLFLSLKCWHNSFKERSLLQHISQQKKYIEVTSIMADVLIIDDSPTQAANQRRILENMGLML